MKATSESSENGSTPQQRSDSEVDRTTKPVGLRERARRDIDHAVALLLSVPGLRSRPVEGYPYRIFYRDREAEVDVWRVLHERRDIPDLLLPASEED